MKRRFRFWNNGKEEAPDTLEVDLAPMLALMVTLIPIMLLSTVFVTVTVIDTPLPQVVRDAIEKDRNDKKRNVNVTLKMRNQTGFSIVIDVDGKTVNSIQVPKQGKDWDLDNLRRELVNVKTQYPKIFRIDLDPGTTTKYNDIVRVMDEARRTKEGDSKLFIYDKETQQQVETNVLFPDVVFSKVVEG